MRFTIKGSRNGSRVQVTWTDGVRGSQSRPLRRAVSASQ